MCWNKDVSLNTFAFSSFVLLLILYNNKYTSYKINDFSKFWMCVFFSAVILMQLVEYFIWVNIDNVFYNKLFTYLAMLIIFVQPITTIMNVSNVNMKQLLLSAYLILATPSSGYYIYNQHKNIYSTVSSIGNLQWNNYDKNVYSNALMLFWLFFLLFPLFYEKYTSGLLFGILTLLIVAYNYSKYESVSSMWCWILNSVMLYYAGQLLFYLPFVKSI